MKKSLVFLTGISIILNIGLVYFFIFKGDVIQLENNRQAIVISEENKDYVLAEMRSFLESIQQINQGILNEDPTLIIEASNKAGQVVANKTPKGLMKSLPIAFKKLGISTHNKFKEIADDAQKSFTIKSTQNKLNSLLNNCVSCHQTFEIKTN